MFSSHKSSWKRLVIALGDLALFYLWLAFRIHCTEVPFTSISVVREDSLHAEVSFCLLHRLFAISNEEVCLWKNGVFASHLFLSYFRRQTVLSDNQGTYHPVPFESQSCFRDDLFRCQLCSEWSFNSEYFCILIVRVEEEMMIPAAEVTASDAETPAAPATVSVQLVERADDHK